MGDDKINRPNYQVNQEILDLFPKLHCNDAKLRLRSANKILKIISKDKCNCDSHDFNYVVERLIKGTKSNKDSSKIGSTILLTEILFSFPDFQVNRLFDIAKRVLGDVDDDLSLEGVTGWTLIFTAIVQSNRLDISEKKTLERLIRFMVQLGVKKPRCNVAICNIFAKLFASQFEPESFGKILNSSLKLNESGDSHPFHLYLILLINKHPELSLVLDHIPTVDLDSPGNLVDYVKATVVHLPLVHPACLELFYHLNENDKLQNFWGPVFNDTLFGLDHSRNGAYHRLGFSLVSSILPHLNESNAKLIFSKQMMDLWMQCLANRSNRLHDVAANLSKELIEKYDDYNASLQEIIISLLTEFPGTVNFDDITHLNIVNQLYIKTKSEAVDVLVSRTIEKIKNYKALSARDRMRTLFVGQLRDLLKSSHLSESIEIKLNVLKFFLAHGYFDVSNISSLKLCTPTTEGLNEKIRILFFKVISSTCTKLEILESIGLYVLRLLKAEVPLKDEKNLLLWKKVKKMKKQFLVANNEEKYSKQLSIFKPLLYGIAISSFQDKADLNALNSDFEELIECYKRSLGENSEDNEPEWPDVLLDMMISQFPSQSVFLSSIMIRVFRLIVFNITLEGVEQLKIALLADKLEDDDDDEVGEDDEEEENVEKPDGMSDSDGEGEDMDDEEPDDVDDEFRAKVTLALGPAAEIGDEFGATVDDEEMFQLDEALSEAFRSKYSKDKNIQATLKTLRARCLELVEIIFKSKDVSYGIILHLVPVLIDAIKLYNGPKDAELRNRVAKILTQLPILKKLKSQQTVDFEILESILKKAVDLASKIEILTVQKCAARIYVWIMSIGKIIGKDIDCGFDNLNKLLADFFIKANSSVSKEFFMIVFQNHQVHDSKLVETICRHVFGNLRPFKKVGGLSLLSAYLKCFKNAITQDGKTKSLLATIKKESFAGLMSAVNAKKNLLTNEYLILLFVLSKITPLNLTPEEVSKIVSMNKSIRGNLTKAGKVARNKILSTADKSDDEINQSDNEEDQSEDGDDENDVANGKYDVGNQGDIEMKQNDIENDVENDIENDQSIKEDKNDVEEKQIGDPQTVNDIEENQSSTESQQHDSKNSQSDIDENRKDIEIDQDDIEINQNNIENGQDIENEKKEVDGSRNDISSNQNITALKEPEKSSSEAMDVDDKEANSDKSLKTMAVDTPMRLTRSKAKRVKVRTEEEQSEADDEMPSFSVPRVAVVETPLRRSLRNRNSTKT